MRTVSDNRRIVGIGIRGSPPEEPGFGTIRHDHRPNASRCSRSKRIARGGTPSAPPPARVPDWQQRQFQCRSEGAAAVPGFEDGHRQPDGDRRNEEESGSMGEYQQRDRVSRARSGRACPARTGAGWREDAREIIRGTGMREAFERRFHPGVRRPRRRNSSASTVV